MRWRGAQAQRFGRGNVAGILCTWRRRGIEGKTTNHRKPVESVTLHPNSGKLPSARASTLLNTRVIYCNYGTTNNDCTLSQVS
jgi:hypothetical protein